jgi:hypothetical protein
MAFALLSATRPSLVLLVTISKLSRSAIIAGDPYRKKPQR